MKNTIQKLALILGLSLSAKAYCQNAQFYTLTVTGSPAQQVTAQVGTLEQCQRAADSVAKSGPAYPTRAFCIGSDGSVLVGTAEKRSCWMSSCFVNFSWGP